MGFYYSIVKGGATREVKGQPQRPPIAVITTRAKKIKYFFVVGKEKKQLNLLENKNGKVTTKSSLTFDLPRLFIGAGVDFFFFFVVWLQFKEFV